MRRRSTTGRGPWEVQSDHVHLAFLHSFRVVHLEVEKLWTRWNGGSEIRTGLNNELNQPPNFERLVLFCIEAKFCIQILIGKHFSRSTRFAILCTAQNSNSVENRQTILRNWILNIQSNLLIFNMKNAISRRNGDEILSEFREDVQKCPISSKVPEILQFF